MENGEKERERKIVFGSRIRGIVQGKTVKQTERPRRIRIKRMTLFLASEHTLTYLNVAWQKGLFVCLLACLILNKQNHYSHLSRSLL